MSDENNNTPPAGQETLRLLAMGSPEVVTLKRAGGAGGEFRTELDPPTETKRSPKFGA